MIDPNKVALVLDTARRREGEKERRREGEKEMLSGIKLFI
jgi:hypothetical protein